jgi:glycosyltransferase involved in cell wall biosynthesis
MKRILMIVACPFPGNRGTPAVILQTANELIKKGFSVEVLTYANHDYDIDPSSHLRAHRIPKLPFSNDNSPGPKIYKPFADLLLLVKGTFLLRKNKYDIIHGHHIEGGLVAGVLKLIFKTPTVYHSHIILEQEITSYDKYGSAFIKQILKRVEKFCYKGADATIYLENEILHYAKINNLESKVNEVITGGVDIKQIENIADKSINPVSQNRTAITYTGSIAKYQNLTDIIETARLMSEIEAEFYIVTGETPEKGQYLQDLIKKYSLEDRFHVIYNKSFEEQIAYVKFADVLLSPRRECGGVPMKLVNYMALGKKVVCSTGSAKILDNESAYVHQNGDYIDFKAKLIDALQDKGQTKGKAARKLAELYDWDVIIQKVISVYERTLSK